MADETVVVGSRSWTVKEILNAGLLYSGVGAPTITAADGALYQRTDGDLNTSLYMRIKGVWQPMAAASSTTPPTPTPTPTPSPTPTPTPTPGRPLAYYGSGHAATSLGNLVVGRGQEVAVRFKCWHTGNITSVHWYNIYGTGYGSGSGGTIKITIQGNDTEPNPGGTAEGRPDGKPISNSSAVMNNPVGATNFPVNTFNVPIPVVAGTIYHVVYTNVDADPANNWVSTDHLDIDYSPAAVPTPINPPIPIADECCLLRNVSGGVPWKEHPGDRVTPCLDLAFDDGFHQGWPYMEVWVRKDPPDSNTGLIDTVNRVRQVFTPTNTFSAKALGIRYGRVNTGTDPLHASIQQANGTLIERVVFPAAEAGYEAGVTDLTYARKHRWVEKPLAATRTFTAGQTYHVILTSTTATQYRAYAIRSGTGSYAFHASLRANGRAEYSINSGGSWSGWKSAGHDNLSEADLQWYLRYA